MNDYLFSRTYLLESNKNVESFINLENKHLVTNEELQRIPMKKLLILVMALLFIASAYAQTIERNDVFYAYYNNAGQFITTTTPITQANAIGFVCDQRACSSVSSQYLSQISSGSTNRFNFAFPTQKLFTGNGGYGVYIFKDGFIPWEIFANYTGTVNPPVYPAYLSKIETCRIAIDEFDVVNSLYPNMPIMIDVATRLDSSVASPINNAGPLQYIPPQIRSHYQVNATAILEIRNSNGVLVNTQSLPMALDYSSTKRANFSYTPTQTGRYTATVIATTTDGKCLNSESTFAQQNFDIFSQNPSQMCYLQLNNLSFSNPQPFVNETITVSFTKLANSINEYGVLSSLPSELYVTITTNGTVVHTRTIQTGATSTSLPQVVSFAYTPQYAGYHAVTVTGVNPTCQYPTNSVDTVTTSLYVVGNTTVPANNAPVISPLPNFNYTTSGFKDNLFNFPLFVVDPDGDVLTYSIVSQSNTAVAVCSLDVNRNVDCAVSAVGCSVVTLRAHDGQAFTDASFNVCRTTNLPPVWNTIPTVNLPLNTSTIYSNIYDLDNFVSDPEQDFLTIAIVSQSNTVAVSCALNSQNVLSCATTALGCSQLVVSAHDGQNTAQTSFSVCATPNVAANNPPYWLNLANITLAANSGFNNNLFLATQRSVDIDGDVLTYSIVSQSNAGVVSCTFDAQNFFDCAVVPNQVGCSAVVVSVSDGLASAQATQHVCVVAVNQPPVWSPITTPNLPLGFSPNIVDLDNYVVDPNGDALTISLIAQSNTSAMICSLNGQNQLSCTVSAYGCSVLTAQADDGQYIVSTQFLVCATQTTPVNNPPVWSAIPAVNVTLGSGFNNNLVYTPAYVTDVDGDTLTLSIVGQTNPNAVICSLDVNGYLDCTAAALGCSVVSINAHDGQASAVGTVLVCVVSAPVVNTPPVWAPIPAVNITLGSGFNNNLRNIPQYASDVDGDVLTFALVGQSNTASVICSLDSQNQLDCTPAVLGCSTLTLRVSDGVANVFTTMQVCVVSAPVVNTPPVWSAIPAVNVTLGSGFNNNLRNIPQYASDLDGDVLTFALVGQSNPSAVVCALDLQNQLDCTPAALGCSVLTYSVTDGFATVMTTSQVCVVSAPASNNPPVWSAIPVVNVTLGSGFNNNLVFIPNYVSDLDGDVLTLSIIGQSNTASVVCVLDSVGYLDCTPAALGCSVVSINAHDGQASAVGTVLVCVVNAPVTNLPPYANFPVVNMPQNTTPQIVMNLTQYVGDPENDPLTIQLVNQSAPHIVQCQLLVNAQLECTPQPNRYGTSILTIRISDGVNVIYRTITVNVTRDLSAFTSYTPDTTRISDRLYIAQFKVLEDITIPSDRELQVFIDVRNDADIDFKDVRVAIVFPELGLRSSVGPFDMPIGRIYTKSFYMQTYGPVSPGYYTVRMTITSANGIERIVHREVLVR
jgi:hypothetical protein